jgi:hypothetical protein
VPGHTGGLRALAGTGGAGGLAPLQFCETSRQKTIYGDAGNVSARCAGRFRHARGLF